MPIKFSIAKRGSLPTEELQQNANEGMDLEKLRIVLECPTTVDAIELQSGSLRLPSVLPKGELQALAKEKLPFPAGHVLLYKSPIPGIVTVNMTNAINIDGTHAASMTEAEVICRFCGERYVFPPEELAAMCAEREAELRAKRAQAQAPEEMP